MNQRAVSCALSGPSVPPVSSSHAAFLRSADGIAARHAVAFLKPDSVWSAASSASIPDSGTRPADTSRRSSAQRSSALTGSPGTLTAPDSSPATRSSCAGDVAVHASSCAQSNWWSPPEATDGSRSAATVASSDFAADASAGPASRSTIGCASESSACASVAERTALTPAATAAAKSGTGSSACDVMSASAFQHAARAAGSGIRPAADRTVRSDRGSNRASTYPRSSSFTSTRSGDGAPSSAGTRVRAPATSVSTKRTLLTPVPSRS